MCQQPRTNTGFARGVGTCLTPAQPCANSSPYIGAGGPTLERWPCSSGRRSGRPRSSNSDRAVKRVLLHHLEVPLHTRHGSLTSMSFLRLRLVMLSRCCAACLVEWPLDSCASVAAVQSAGLRAHLEALVAGVARVVCCAGRVALRRSLVWGCCRAAHRMVRQPVATCRQRGARASSWAPAAARGRANATWMATLNFEILCLRARALGTPTVTTQSKATRAADASNPLLRQPWLGCARLSGR